MVYENRKYFKKAHNTIISVSVILPVTFWSQAAERPVLNQTIYWNAPVCLSARRWNICKYV
jgi:hypothetical protein